LQFIRQPVRLKTGTTYSFRKTHQALTKPMSPQLFKIIATFFLAYLIFRVFTAWILPMIARWYINRYKKRFYEQNPHAKKAGERHRHGSMHITYTDDTGKADTGKLGEYVDYEELNNNDQQPE